MVTALVSIPWLNPEELHIISIQRTTLRHHNHACRRFDNQFSSGASTSPPNQPRIIVFAFCCKHLKSYQCPMQRGPARPLPDLLQGLDNEWMARWLSSSVSQECYHRPPHRACHRLYLHPSLTIPRISRGRTCLLRATTSPNLLGRATYYIVYVHKHQQMLERTRMPFSINYIDSASIMSLHFHNCAHPQCTFCFLKNMDFYMIHLQVQHPSSI